MKHALALLGLLCTALFWGLSFNAGKVAVHYVPPMTAAALRFLVAAALLAAIVPLAEKGCFTQFRRNWLGYLLMAVAGVVGFNTFFFFGMRYTSPTNGALIMATNPLVTALIAAILIGEPISKKHKIGTMISFFGVAVLVLFGTAGHLVGINVGDMLVLGANISMALYAIIGKHLLKGSTPLMTTAASSLFGALILFAASHIVSHDAVVLGLPWQPYAAILFMGVFGSVIAYIFWNHGIRTIGVADTAIFFHLVPVFAVLGSVVLGQLVTWVQVGAGAVVIFGVAISSGAIKTLMSFFRGSDSTAPAAIAGSNSL